MNRPFVHVSMAAPQRARVGPRDELIEASPGLDALNSRAGGRTGTAVALPALARIAQLARSLRTPVARMLVVADEHVDLELRARAVPDVSGQRGEVELFVDQLTAREPRSSWLAIQPADATASQADTPAWTWRSDRTLVVTGLSLAPDDPSSLQPSDVVGLPLTRLLRLVENEAGDLPILSALAGGSDFASQHAVRRDLSSVAWTLSAYARRDQAGHFVGFDGTAVVAVDRIEAPRPLLSAAVTKRLQGALRAPLDRIVERAEGIGAQAEGPIRRDYADYAGDIARAGRHLLALVDDLADLEAIEDPQFTVEREPIDLADLGRRGAGLLAVRAANANVRIDAPASGEQAPARGDFTRALQIVVNLIGNAVRYSPSGSTIWVRCERDDDSAVLIIADQGKGIALGDQVRIFEKFERVDASEAEGSGLGLYISRRLARAMGGDIAVDSAPGQGARFVLTLPAA